jgi:hypothetical protein
VPTTTEYHSCDWTTECDCEDGEEGWYRRHEVHPPTRGEGQLELWLKAYGCNPCSPSFSIGGELDMQATILINTETKTLRLTAIIDSFSSF